MIIPKEGCKPFVNPTYIFNGCFPQIRMVMSVIQLLKIECGNKTHSIMTMWPKPCSPCLLFQLLKVGQGKKIRQIDFEKQLYCNIIGHF